MGVKTADFFRALDDSGLDVYEIRFLMRVWRRGKCWEKLQSIAQSTGISVGKASTVRRDLLAAGWLAMGEFEGHIVYEVAIPDCCSVSPHETEFHDMKQDFHQVKQEFHVVHALPNNIQQEDYNIKDAPAPVDDDRLALERAKAATLELMAFWAELTGRPIPLKTHPDNIRWFKAFNAIWIQCGRDTDNARGRIQAIRDDMLGRGITLFDPDKLRGHVKTAIDAELLPMTQRMNGQGAPAAVESETLWQRAIREIGSGRVEDDLLRRAIQAIGGSSSIKMANEYTASRLKERLYHEYRNIATA